LALPQPETSNDYKVRKVFYSRRARALRFAAPDGLRRSAKSVTKGRTMSVPRRSAVANITTAERRGTLERQSRSSRSGFSEEFPSRTLPAIRTKRDQLAISARATRRVFLAWLDTKPTTASQGTKRCRSGVTPLQAGFVEISKPLAVEGETN
jgi:hypothetical protein